jgi:catechol 2,3-dioxygenase-like lactoylglutathione lyase family enzyme
MPPRMQLSGIVLDTPDPRSLAGFYRRLLGWEVIQDEPEWMKLAPSTGVPGLSFQLESDYKRPSWPAGDGDQRMMVHLDIEVDDLEEAGKHATEAGAVLADFQPQDDVRVFFDPDGHPFCLFIDTWSEPAQ